MMKPLDQRLSETKDILNQVEQVFAANLGDFPSELHSTFSAAINYRNEIENWVNLFNSRAVIRNFLGALESTVDADDQVTLGGTPVKYQYARLMGVNALLTVAWSLSDSITTMVSQVMCIPEIAQNVTKPANLVSTFISSKDGTKKLPMLLGKSIQTVGWPIAISYAIRNLFVHDGAFTSAGSFFEGPLSGNAFRIATVPWNKIKEKASMYGVTPNCIRPNLSWPNSPADDLRVLLDVCFQEMDASLGVLIKTASMSLAHHVGIFLGQD